MKKILLILSSLSLFFSGCSTFTYMVNPTVSTKALPIQTANYKPKSYNFPISDIVIENSSLVINRELTDNEVNNLGMSFILFGASGPLLQSGSLKEKTRRNTLDITLLEKLKVNNIVAKEIRRLKNSSQLSSKLKILNVATKEVRYVTQPFIYYSYNESLEQELQCVLDIVQLDKSNSIIWRGRYIYHLNITNSDLLKNEKVLNKTVSNMYKDLLKYFQLHLERKIQINNENNKQVNIWVKNHLTMKRGHYLNARIIPTNNKDITLIDTGSPLDFNAITGGIHIYKSKDIIVKNIVNKNI